MTEVKDLKTVQVQNNGGKSIMFPVNTHFNPFHHFHGSEMEQGFFNSTNLVNLSTSQKQETDITIMTAEGDKVTISGETQFQADYFDYSSMRKTKGSYLEVQGARISFESSSDFSLIVDGDLSEEEMHDIKIALQSIDKVMKGVVAGDMDKSILMLSTIGNLDSINGLKASMSYEKSVSYNQQSTLEIQDMAPTKGIEEGDAPNLADPVNNITKQMLKPIEGIDPKKTVKPLDRYFRPFFNGLSNEESEKSDRYKLAKALRRRMFQNLMNKPAEDFPEIKEEQKVPSTEKNLVGQVDDLIIGLEGEEITE